MTRLAIIDTESHTLFIEDVPEKTLAEYGNDARKYIEDNYCIHDGFKWGVITSAQYIPDKDDTEVYDIDFKSIAG